MIKVKEIAEVSHADLFFFAEKMYGIHWNAANKFFFNTVLEYGKINKICLGDLFDFTEYFQDHFDDYYTDAHEEIKPMVYKDIPREYIDSASDDERAYIILGVFIEENNIKHDVYMDCS